MMSLVSILKEHYFIYVEEETSYAPFCQTFAMYLRRVTAKLIKVTKVYTGHFSTCHAILSRVTQYWTGNGIKYDPGPDRSEPVSSQY